MFADGPGGGNPCPVVFGADGRPTSALQAQAAEFGAETAFVLAPEQAGTCGCATSFRATRWRCACTRRWRPSWCWGRTGRCRGARPRSRRRWACCEVRWDADSATVSQFLPQFGPALSDEASRARLLAALGVSEDALATGVGPVVSVSTARPKLMIPLVDEATLDSLAPDFDALESVCDELGVTGAYPFTLDAAGADVAARQFPVRAGYAEDPATGVAACALGAYLAVQGGGVDGWRSWRIAQGRAIGRPSLIVAEALVEDGAVVATRVGGSMQRSGPPADRL